MELERHESYFTDLVTQLLSSYEVILSFSTALTVKPELVLKKLVNSLSLSLSLMQKKLRPSIDRIEKYVENLKSLSEGYLD